MSETLKILVFPGSFDPFTLGHLDIVNQSLKWCDHLIILVAHHPQKKSWLSMEQKSRAFLSLFEFEPRVEVVFWDGLLVDFLQSREIDTIVRGLRNAQDYQYELQLLEMHRQLFPEIKMMWIQSSQEHRELSSSFIREVYHYGRKLGQWVPESFICEIDKC
jgi:pantetheine-phosphate adenylyltransferase